MSCQIDRAAARYGVVRYDLTPLKVCERPIGPGAEIARVLGYVRTAPTQWLRPAESREAGDLPSAPIMRKLLAHSDRFGLGLTADHLIHRASEAEIAAILSARAGVAAEGGFPAVA